MAVREIVMYAEHEAVLRRESEPVKAVTRSVRRLVRDLEDTLYAHPDGAGLAAPQIGVHRCVVVVRLGACPDEEREPGPPEALINPVIIEAGDERSDFDGCLSFPGLFGKTIRPHQLRISAWNEAGQAIKRTLEGFDAVLVHHEIDHLKGIVFVDRIQDITDLCRVRRNEQGQLVRVPLDQSLRQAAAPRLWDN